MLNYLACRPVALLLAAVIVFISPARLPATELPGYQSHREFEQSLEALTEHPRVTRTSLGTTAEGRDVWMLTLAKGDANAKPAVLVMGSVDAANLTGSELAVRMAQQIADGNATETKLLDEVTIYVIPRPSPDVSAALLATPTTSRKTNTRQTDADRDGTMDEDPNEDLNGDGVITSLRVADPAGPWMQHPNDERVLIRADAKKNETGQYRIYSEGIDNDDDELLNEDGPGGVDFNRNFTFEYPYFAGDAGPHQVSEPETRAVVDWMVTRPNIFLVFSFAPQDNLTKPWTPSKNNGGRIKRQVLKDDGSFYQFLSSKYGKQVGKKNAPSAASGKGDFAHWAYFHYGRWSLATRGWWIPKVEPKKKAEPNKSDKVQNDKAQSDEAQPEEGKAEESKGTDKPGESDEGSTGEKADDTSKSADAPKKKADSRNPADRNALAWFAEQDIDGFADWTEIDHPDFPGKRVEVGGFKPLVREHPPAGKLDDLATKHREYIASVVGLRAKLEFEPAKIESLGAGVYRITTAVVNQGFLPTVSAMGRTARKLQRLDLEIVLPEGGKLLTGRTRENLGVLAGNGGRSEQVWLVRLAKVDEATELKLRAGEPSIGFIEQILSVTDNESTNDETQNAN